MKEEAKRFSKDNAQFTLNQMLRQEEEEKKLFEKNDLIEKEDIDINEDRIDKNKIKNKFKLTKKTRNIILIGSVIVLLLAIYIGKTVSKYENKIFPGTLVYEQDISNLENNKKR